MGDKLAQGLARLAERVRNPAGMLYLIVYVKNRVGFSLQNGFSDATPVAAKSAVFPVTTTAPCRSAVAAIIRVIDEKPIIIGATCLKARHTTSSLRVQRGDDGSGAGKAL